VLYLGLVFFALFQPDLKSPFPPVADRFGREIFFALQRQVYDPSLGRVQLAEREGPAVLSNVIGGEMGHCVKLGLACLPEPFSNYYETVLAVELATVNLEKQNLNGVQHFAIFSKRQMCVIAA
jgi:hypothetical protein